MKYVSLVILVFQTTTLVLTMRYSRTIDGPLYFSSTAVLLAEGVKLVFCVMIILYEGRNNINKAIEQMRQDTFGNMTEFMMVSIPALLYAVQNNLLFVALSNLDAATYQVIYQLKILTTAGFAVLVLGKSLYSHQWASLLILTLGVTLVQWQSSKGEVRC